MASPTGTSKTEQVYRALREAILQVRLPPSEHLRLNDLCRQHGFGWTPLREALSRLEAEGLVEAEVNRGFRVAPISRESFADLIAARATIESALVAQAIEAGGDDWLKAVEAACEALVAGPQPGPDVADDALQGWEARHLAFHRMLAAGAPSQTLKACNERIGELLARHCRHLLLEPFRRSRESEAARAARREALAEAAGAAGHRRICERALRRDGAGARAAIEAHARAALAAAERFAAA